MYAECESICENLRKIQNLQPNVIMLSNKMMNQILPNLNTSFIPSSKKIPDIWVKK